MAYVSHADIEERLGTATYVQLTDDAGTGSADLDKITEAQLAAEGEVNSFLGRRYAVPINLTNHSELSGLLKSITLDLIEFRLHARRPPVASDIRYKREAAMNWLRGVASGQWVLPSSSEIDANTGSGILGEATGPDRVMTSEELEDL
jgi:phage gp36-like protein